MAQTLSTKDEFARLIADYDNFLFDCDGVIWHGDELIKGVPQVLKLLRSKGKKLIFVTNNATKSREAFKKKFDKLGIEASVDEIFGSAFATAAYLKDVLKFPSDKYVYVIGEDGIEHELDSVGIKYKGGTDPDDNTLLPSMDFSSIKSDSSIGAVMCGFDVGTPFGPRTAVELITDYINPQMKINYKKLAKAFRYLLDDEDCLFILTNDDSTFPTEKTLFPGSGSLSAPLRFALPNRKPIVVGKPNQPMLDSILARHKLDKKKTLMIGDRLDTDIAFGLNGDIKTLLVLTGVNKRKDFEEPGSKIIPDLVVESFGDLNLLVES